MLLFIYLQHVIGGGGIGLSPSTTKKGFEDGSFHEALFHSPQGICFKNSHILFVCDTENHAIRMVSTLFIILELFKKCSKY